MKLDLLKRQWLDIVFEGRNKLYGAYRLRLENPRTSIKALVIGGFIFALLVSLPVLASFLPKGNDDDASLDKKIVTIKLPPKEQPKDLPPPPPPKPKVDQVKFVKPVVAKAEDVVEEPLKVKDLDNKQISNVNAEGDPNAAPTILPPGTGDAVGEPDDNSVHSMAGIEVKPDYPGGLDKFYKYVMNNYKIPEEDGINGNVIVSFVVEKDGSLTDIQALRDVGFGTGKEAVRVLKNCPKWIPGEQNGKKVRVRYSLPIRIKSPD